MRKMVCFSSFGQIFSDITHTLLSSPGTYTLEYIHALSPLRGNKQFKPMYINILHKMIYMLVYFLYSIAFLKHAIFLILRDANYAGR